VANVPILYAKCRTVKRDAAGREVPVEIGPNSLVDLDKDGEIGYAEHKGEAIGKAQEEIDKSKANMAALGLLALAERPKAQKTATETVVDNNMESSELGEWARGLEDGLEIALTYHADFLNQKKNGSIKVNRDFAKLGLDTSKISTLSNMVAARQLSVETLWTMLEKGEELPSDFTAEAEHARIAEDIRREAAAFAPAALPPAA
jgi:hypothetical protein